MNSLLLLLTWLAPLCLALLALRRRIGSYWPAPLAALPALLTALVVPAGTQVEIPWCLLGAQFGLEGTDPVFLLFAAVLWLIAGLHADLSMGKDPRLGRFRLYFLLAMAGNFWLIVGQDLVNFYLGFSLMGFAAYGLVVHDGAPASLRAGRVYLVMTLVAEAALLAAFLLIFANTQSFAPTPMQLRGLSDWAIGLLLLGMGIKAGLVPLHVWLPLAHPAAPIAASAVLSGSMVKVALIGLMRFLPLGQEALVDWGNLLAIAGTITILYAVPMGLVQTNPKVVLAYSSVGKMGLMTAFVGLVMLTPSMAAPVVTALAFYAAHHGIAKGALFLGVGVARTTNALRVLPVLALPALVLAGAPLTSGALAKAQIEPSLSDVQGLWADVIPALLVVSTIGTTLLMARFLTLVSTSRSAGSSGASRAIWIPWTGIIAIILCMPFASGSALPSFITSWPLAAGAVLALPVLLLQPDWAKRLTGSVPPGDLIEPFAELTQRLSRRLRSTTGRFEWQLEGVEAMLRKASGHRLKPTPSTAQILHSWPVAGAAVLSIGATLFILL